MCTHLNHLDREIEPLHLLLIITAIIMVFQPSTFHFLHLTLHKYLDVLKYKPFYRLSAGEFDDEDKIEDVDALLQR